MATYNLSQKCDCGGTIALICYNERNFFGKMETYIDYAVCQKCLEAISVPIVTLMDAMNEGWAVRERDDE